MVKAGTYVENVVFKESGKADAPISLISADGTGAAKIKPAKAATATIYGFGEENIVVRGFDITAQSKTNGIQFGMAGTNFKDLTKSIVIQNNIIRSAVRMPSKFPRVTTSTSWVTRSSGQPTRGSTSSP
jgi:hypothetical protein